MKQGEIRVHGIIVGADGSGRGLVTRPPAPGRPRLRGWIHAVAAPFVLAAGIVLTCRAPTVAAATATAVFAATAAWLFTVSALYHLGTWPPGAQLILRRIDHADILFLIAGSYTPLAVLALRGDARAAILAAVWAGAALGAVFCVAWTDAPRWLYVLVYLGVGWAAAFVLPQLLRGAGLTALVLIAAGGLLYSLGGLAYGLRRPDPWPGWFGFHEVFHACTVVAFACQYIAVWIVVSRAA
jgi:hemolysin III